MQAAAVPLALVDEIDPWSPGRSGITLSSVAIPSSDEPDAARVRPSRPSHEAANDGAGNGPAQTSTAEAPPAEADTSSALVARAQSGDRSAFRALFDRHRADVARLVYRMVGPRAELEDLVQEVFVQVHRSLRDFRGEARFSTWLHRVTVNVVLMHRRAERSRPVLTEEAPSGTIEDVASVHPDDEAERRARIAAFFDVLKEISEKKRVVFVLHDLEGMSPAEIANVVGAPVLTVRTRLFYARRELEQKMRERPLLASVLATHGGFAGDPAENASQTRRKASPSTPGDDSSEASSGGDR